MSTSGCIKVVCALFSLIIFGLLCAGGLTYWRDIHNIPDQNLSFYQKWMFESITFGTSNQYAVYKNDEIIAQVGITNICKSKIESAQDDCKYFEKTVNFITNTAINILMMVAASIYLLYFNVLCCCSKKTCILPFLCFGATLCIIAAISIFWINDKEIYINLSDTITESQRVGMKELGFTVHDDYVTILLPWKITFGIGFYLVLGAAALSVFTMLLSINLALITPEKKKPSATPPAEEEQQQQPPTIRPPLQQRQCPQPEGHHQFQSYPPQSSAPPLNCPYQQGFSASHYPTQTTPIYQPPLSLQPAQSTPICPLTSQHQQYVGFTPQSPYVPPYTPSHASHQQVYITPCTPQPPPAAPASASSSVPSSFV
uniref:Uncharacterized protein n=1 Tax=Panagrolaimus sp. PS1159 TaxID=55785 RepID=A0AC35FIL5_9BILA